MKARRKLLVVSRSTLHGSIKIRLTFPTPRFSPLFLYPDPPENNAGASSTDVSSEPVSTAGPSSTKATSISVSSAGPSSTVSQSPSSGRSLNQNKSHSGKIAGAVVGPLAGVSLLIWVILWYLRRWRSRTGVQPARFSDGAARIAGAFGLPDPNHSMAIGRYYVRAKLGSLLEFLLISDFLC